MMAGNGDYNVCVWGGGGGVGVRMCVCVWVWVGACGDGDVCVWGVGTCARMYVCRGRECMIVGVPVRMCVLLYITYNYKIVSSIFASQQLLQVVAILILAGVANVYMFIVGAAVTVVLIGLRYYYVAPAIELRRLEAVGASTFSIVYMPYTVNYNCILYTVRTLQYNTLYLFQ